MTTKGLMERAAATNLAQEKAWCAFVASLPVPVSRYVLRNEMELHDAWEAGQIDFDGIRVDAIAYVETLT